MDRLTNLQSIKFPHSRGIDRLSNHVLICEKSLIFFFCIVLFNIKFKSYLNVRIIQILMTLQRHHQMRLQLSPQSAQQILAILFRGAVLLGRYNWFFFHWLNEVSQFKYDVIFFCLTSFLSDLRSPIDLRPSASRMYGVPPHCVRPVDAVQFEVQSAGVAYHLAFDVPSPDRRRPRTAVRAGQVHPTSYPGCRL